MLSVKESTDVILSWGGGGVLPYERLMGMCRWMGSHFHDQTASSVSFSSDLVRGVHARASVEQRNRKTRETRAFCSTDQEKRETARSIFHDWTDYNGVAFSIQLLE